MRKLKWILALTLLMSGCSLRNISFHTERDVLILSAHIQLKDNSYGQDPIR